MSVVNQMLRDLEKRRAGERHGSGAVFNGVIATGETRGGRPLLFAVLGLVVVVLGGAVGWLLWDRHATQQTVAATQVASSVAALHAAVVAPPAEPAAMPVTPGFVALQPAEERKVERVVVGAEEPRAPVAAPAPRRHEPPPVAPVAASAPVATVAPVHAAPVSTAVEKKELPPTPQQLAALAYQKGYEALNAGQREEAERQLRDALRHDPAHVAARESLAGLLLTAGRRVEAGEVLEAGIKVKPEVANFRMLNARLHMEQGDLDGAVATLEGGVASAVRNGDYQALLGALYQRQGAFARSIDAYQQAIMIDPARGVWWLGLAISADRNGQGADALTAYHKALDAGVGDQLATYAGARIKALETEAKKK